ncbi:MAG: MmgE/PrpD family protein [Gammaproteobacteria bacterium]
MNSEKAAVNVIEAYGEWIATTPANWGSAAIESAQRQLIDTIAVMVPGALEPATRITLKTVAGWGVGNAGANVTGYTRTLPTPWAALVNGTAAHALDFDDNFDPAKTHASAVLYPAILALADINDSSGIEVLDAYITGLQIMGRIGQGVNPIHRNRGWHATATVGVFGAAAACARLLKLDADQAGHALSLASSMSSGFMSQFGTLAKPLHAGLAAKGGIIAAGLAEQGMEAGKHTLDGPTGMNTLMVGPDREQLKQALTGAEHGQTLSFETENIGSPLHITEYGFRVKRFPNCGSAHRAMDILLELIQAHDIDAREVEKIEVHAPKSHLDNLFYHDPVTGLEAKFSMQYALACLLETGYCSLQDFTDEAVARPGIRSHFTKIELHPVDKLESVCPTRLLVYCRGKQYELSASMPRGSLAAPFTTAQYQEKFDACVSGLLSATEASALWQALEHFQTLVLSKDMTRHFAVDFDDNLNPSRRSNPLYG